MSYTTQYTGSFQKDYKKLLKRGYDIELLQKAITILIDKGTLPVIPYKTHPLKGNFKNYFDAHIQPDWLLIWKADQANKIIYLTRTGTHSDIFG